jgi:FkbM family methyltransferase
MLQVCGALITKGKVIFISDSFSLRDIDRFQIKGPFILRKLFSIVWHPCKGRIMRKIQSAAMSTVRSLVNFSLKSTQTFNFRLILDNKRPKKVKFQLDLQLFRVKKKIQSEVLLCALSFIIRKELTCIIDVGSNLGLVSAQMSLYSPELKILAFEPQAKCVEISKQLYSFVGADATVHELALGNEAKKMIIRNSNTMFSGYAHLEDNQNFEGGQIVNMTTLDTFLSINQLPRIDLIKIDVEGFELEVLKGATSTISKLKPVILYEDWGQIHNSLDKTIEIAAFLTDLNYSLFVPFFVSVKLDEPIFTAYKPLKVNDQNMRIALVPIEFGDEFYQRKVFNVINVVAINNDNKQIILDIFSSGSAM